VRPTAASSSQRLAEGAALTLDTTGAVTDGQSQIGAARTLTRGPAIHLRGRAADAARLLGPHGAAFGTAEKALAGLDYSAKAGSMQTLARGAASAKALSLGAAVIEPLAAGTHAAVTQQSGTLALSNGTVTVGPVTAKVAAGIAGALRKADDVAVGIGAANLATAAAAPATGPLAPGAGVAAGFAASKAYEATPLNRKLDATVTDAVFKTAAGLEQAAKASATALDRGKAWLGNMIKAPTPAAAPLTTHSQTASTSPALLPPASFLPKR
jgi:hypothetical protein